MARWSAKAGPPEVALPAGGKRGLRTGADLFSELRLACSSPFCPTSSNATLGGGGQQAPQDDQGTGPRSNCLAPTRRLSS